MSAMDANTQAQKSDLAILMYHEVAEPAAIDALARKIQRGYICTTEEFEQQIGLLRNEGYAFVSMGDMVEANRSGKALPPRAVMITFDDGYEGNFVHAKPILERHRAKATFFVVSNKVGDPSMMSRQQLRALAEAGFEVQSHTANHPLLSTLDERATEAELADSKRDLESWSGQRCEFLSLPNGDTNPYLRAAAERLGYRGVCGSSFGYNDRAALDLLMLDRIAVKGGVPIEQFRRIVSREPSLMRRMRVRAKLKATVASVLGKRQYDRLYNAFFGVEEQDKRRQQA